MLQPRLSSEQRDEMLSACAQPQPQQEVPDWDDDAWMPIGKAARVDFQQQLARLPTTDE